MTPLTETPVTGSTDSGPTPKPADSMTDADAMQDWKGMDGAIAFHLIDRHANDWDDVGQMMNAWLRANKG